MSSAENFIQHSKHLKILCFYLSQASQGLIQA